MITNLFSVFDPSSSLLSLAWSIMLLIPVLISPSLWNTNTTTNNTLINIITIFNNEVKFSLGNTEKSTETIIITLFLTILTINFLALYPQIFSPTSHITVTLPLSLTFWVTLIIFGWTNNTSHILLHLVPQGTPSPLIPFIVIIELTSNLIRPITLCVRLTANLIAGHLLISLLGNFLISISAPLSAMILAVPITLTVLESAVACIQAYVFMTLITLYTTESN